MTIHVDGDAICYIAGHSADSRNGTKGHSLHNVKMILNKIFRNTGQNEYKIFLTNRDPKVNFRTALYPEYKQNRKKRCRECRGTNISKEGVIATEPTVNGLCRKRLFKCLGKDDGSNCDGFAQDGRPVYYQAIRNYLIERFNAEVVEWGEADDWFFGADWVATHDKDIYQLSGTSIYNIKSEDIVENITPLGVLDLLEIPMRDKLGDLIFNKNGSVKHRKELKGNGFIWFCAQMLLGDGTDNIKAPLKGFGDVKIYDLLKDVKSCVDGINIIKEFYEKNSEDKGLMEINAQLLWVSRKPRQIGTLDVIYNHAKDADEEMYETDSYQAKEDNE